MDHGDDTQRVAVAGLRVDAGFHRFVVDELLPGSGLDAATWWSGLALLIDTSVPRNRELLERRAALQARIDAWHREHPGGTSDTPGYRVFLEEIGYLEPEGAAFEIETSGVDPEIATVAGPQLVVPVMNARYALNAANARWGSLYDALYGTDALGDAPEPGPYDPVRGARVIAWARALLDEIAPLDDESHADVAAYVVRDGALTADVIDGRRVPLLDPSLFAGYLGDPSAPTAVLLRHHELHVEIVIDRAHDIGEDDPAGVADVVLEAATTAIMDLEDSIAAVDADDKTAAYRNWLGLMRGDLTEQVPKGGTIITRRLAADRVFTAPDGSSVTLPGRALMLIRNMGHLMYTDTVLDAAGEPMPEGVLDALVTVTAALHDLRKPGGPANSRAGAVYVVKPKLHGPAEAAFTDDVFTTVEQILGLPDDTVKIGLMDEERRTSVNLGETIRALRSRVAFVNTGFLDRTGDEIHTSMEAGPMIPKAEMKSTPWLTAYEDRNVAIALAAGFRGRAQIGKGMWAAPDLMGKMLDEKIGHPLAGANCAWVPSPTAATLHATHYHHVDVAARQLELTGREPAPLDALLTIPVAADPSWSATSVQAELDNNAQGILGYVVRWVDQGIGCSKVPDIHDVALMEDRATCRISSQHIANWLRHGIVDRDDVQEAMQRMAAVVDRQNADDPLYQPMAPGFDGPAYRAARDLVLSGTEQPSGYTEPILHARRRERKRQLQEREA